MSVFDFIKHRETGNSAGAYTMSGRTSNAYGAYQFMPKTWADIQSRSGLNLPSLNEADKGSQDAAADWYMGQIKNQLRHEPTDANLALAWNYGAGGANALLSANPNAPASSIIGGSGSVNSAGGQNVGGMTVGQLINGFNSEQASFAASQGTEQPPNPQYPNAYQNALPMEQIPDAQGNNPQVLGQMPAPQGSGSLPGVLSSNPTGQTGQTDGISAQQMSQIPSPNGDATLQGMQSSGILSAGGQITQTALPDPARGMGGNIGPQTLDGPFLSAPSNGVDPDFWGGDTTGLGPATETPSYGLSNPEIQDAITRAGLSTESLINSDSPALGPVLNDGESSTPEQVKVVAEELATEIDEAPPEEKPGLMARYETWVNSDGNRDKLLAIGTGLLSGSNWQEGFAGASQNLLDLRTNELAGANGGRGFQQVGNVQLSDGSIVGGVTLDTRTGTYYQNGAPMADQTGIRTNNSDAYGSKAQLTASQAQTTQEDLSIMSSQLETFDRVTSNLQDVKYGVEGFVTDLLQFKDTLLSRGVSEEALLRGVTKGELQGMVGQSKTDVVGPGVMTEQDAARVIMALGGDLQSLFDNPAQAIELLGIMKGKTQKRYDVSYAQFASHNQQFPTLGYITPERYGSTGQSSGDVPEGMDPETWKYMTPEERVLFNEH